MTGALVTVIGGLSGAKMIVPAPAPGAVPAQPEISVSPTARPRLSAGIVVPRVSVIAPLMVISSPAQSAMLPSVVAIAALTFTFCPALSRMLPFVVVSAASTFASRPQQATMLPLVAVIGALILTSR